MLNEYPDVMTIKDLENALGISKNTAYSLVRNHIIGSKRIGKKYIIPKNCVIDYLQSAKYTVVEF